MIDVLKTNIICLVDSKILSFFSFEELRKQTGKIHFETMGFPEGFFVVIRNHDTTITQF